MIDLDAWRAKKSAIGAELSHLEQERRIRISLREGLAAELKTLGDECVLMTETEALLLHISGELLGKSTGTIDKLVTAGLRLVFQDQNLELTTETDKQRGKTAIKLLLKENGEAAPIKDSYGGGVLALVGVLLRVTTIMVLDLRRILILDESLAHVSEQYIPATSRFLKKICDELGFEILMVTHQREFAQNADRHYEAIRSEGETTLKLRHSQSTLPNSV